MTAKMLELAEEEFSKLTLPPMNEGEKPHFRLYNGMQGGMYIMDILCNPGEPGTLYIRANEITTGTKLSEKRILNRAVRIFGNEQPVQIEVGMGKGRFIMDMARLHPDRNFVGIEMYDSVLLRAVQKMEEKAAEGTAHDNLRFIRMDARELPLVFGKNEVGRIYLNFSDPWPKARHAKRRLTSTEFLERYDASVPEVGFEQMDFDASHWAQARLVPAPEYRLYPSPLPPLEIERIAPVKVEQLQPEDGPLQVVVEAVRLLPETTHLPVLFLRRIIKPYIVLMGTETAFFYKLRHRYLCINGSAHPYISIPLSWRGIVRRRRCQSNDCHIFHLSHKGLQSLPPFIFQMMTLIQTDRTDSGFFQPADQLIP